MQYVHVHVQRLNASLLIEHGQLIVGPELYAKVRVKLQSHKVGQSNAGFLGHQQVAYLYRELFQLHARLLRR